MLNTIHIEDYFAAVKEAAKKMGLKEQLEKKLEYLANYSTKETECILYKDFAPLSFIFDMFAIDDDNTRRHWFTGGLIFHGNLDSGGGYPTYSVNVSPTIGWSIHT